MMCQQCGKWAGAHATLPGQSRDHLCHCALSAQPPVFVDHPCTPTGFVDHELENVRDNAQPPADPSALCLRLQAEADMWRANGDENLCVLLEEAIAAISQPPAPSVPLVEVALRQAIQLVDDDVILARESSRHEVLTWLESARTALAAAPPPVRERLTDAQLDALRMAPEHWTGPGLGASFKWYEFARAIERALIGGEG
jgi:hypothetical protein